jgi:iron-sulfur cluster assembly accessory protein
MLRRFQALIRSHISLHTLYTTNYLHNTYVVPNLRNFSVIQNHVQQAQKNILEDNEQYIPPNDFYPSKTTNDIIITQECAERINFINQKKGTPNRKLRVRVNGGGCQGFLVEFEMDETTNEDDKIFTLNGAQVVIDDVSLELIRGATVDFVREMSKSSFTVHSNPNATQSCSCGTSFSA